MLSLCFAVVCASASANEDASLTITASRVVELEHSLGNDEFKPRGKFTIQKMQTETWLL